MNRVVFLLIFNFFIVLCVSSQHVTTSRSVFKSKDDIGLSETQAYKMLYENQVKANDSVLKTIFYALGGLGTALILVFASNWWFNDKKVRDIISEIDKKVKDLNKDTLAELTDRINEFSTEKTAEIHQAQTKLQEDVTKEIRDITLKFTDFTDRIREEIKENDKDISLNFQKQLDVFNDNFKQQTTSLNDNILMFNSNLKDIINGKEEILKNLIENEKKTRVASLDSIKVDIYRNEFWMWDARGVYINALTAQLNELRIIILKGLNLEFYLGQILETCNKLQYISVYDKKELKEVFSSIPNQYSLIANKILSIVDGLKEG